MAEERKSFWSKLKGSKKKESGCCSMKIEELPEDAPEEAGRKDEGDAKQPAPCCGGGKNPSGGGGSCCG